MIWDVAVVGAGPAGSVAAIAALRAWPGARVVLLDRSEFPRDKSCGDGVAPHVLDVLGRLGVPGLLDDWTPIPRLRLGFAGGASASRQMRRAAFVVPRTVLDARLLAAARARGAEFIKHRVREVYQGGAGGEIEIDGVLGARVVIGADGAHSATRLGLGMAAPGDGQVAIALRGYAPVGSMPGDEQVIAFAAEGGWPAYAWSFPIGDGRVNIGYGELLTGAPPTRAHLLRRLDELLPGASAGAGEWRGHHLPLSTARLRQPDGAVLLAGDALSLVNPLTGEGIHAAVLSGALAGIAAARSARLGRPDDAGRAYRLALRGSLGRHAFDVGLLARFTGHRRGIAAGVRACAADAGVFDDLIELGLADGPLTPRVFAGVTRHLFS